MTVTFIVDGKRVELLDRQVIFEEGEQVFLYQGQEKKVYKVANVVKALRCVENNAECELEVYLQ